MSFLGLFRELKSVFERPRHKCPFYGFHTSLTHAAILDQDGNQCGFITQTYTPCPMEIHGKIPDWNQYDLNVLQKEKAEKAIANLVREKFRVYPKEFFPDKGKTWKGLSFKQWLDYVMGDKVKKPEPEK